jgi:hypothetical protein
MARRRSRELDNADFAAAVTDLYRAAVRGDLTTKTSDSDQWDWGDSACFFAVRDGRPFLWSR